MSIKDYQAVYEIHNVSLGSGKTTTVTLQQIYKIYVVTKALQLVNIERIPRKVKKAYFKNKDIVKTYRELKSGLY